MLYIEHYCYLYNIGSNVLDRNGNQKAVKQRRRMWNHGSILKQRFKLLVRSVPSFGQKMFREG